MEWIKNRWVVTAIIFIIVIIAVTIIILLLSQPRQGTYTNAWYVRYGKGVILQSL